MLFEGKELSATSKGGEPKELSYPIIRFVSEGLELWFQDVIGWEDMEDMAHAISHRLPEREEALKLFKAVGRIQ